MLFKENQKLTLITVSEFLATTIKKEIITTRQGEGRQAYKECGKRKEYYLKVDAGMLVFPGWHIPYKVDTETSIFEGNGGYNFLTVSSVMLLKAYIITHNINHTFNKWEQINYDLEGLRGRFSKPLFNEQDLAEIRSHERV